MNDDPMSGMRGSSHLFRRILIFFAVLVMSGGAIYWIIPHTPPKQPGAEAGSPQEEKPVAAETVAPPTENIPNEKASEEVSALRKDAEENAAKTEVATENPVKGVPWQGDPAVDVPEKPVSPEILQTEQALSPDNWRQIEDGTSPLCIQYTISRGDTLKKLANRYHTTIELIKELNHLKSDTIIIGKKLLIVPGPWRIEVSKSVRRLQLFHLAKGKTLFAAYDVGIGRANSTPKGEFVISIRLYHPVYYASRGVAYAYGDPKNPLGGYFLKLAQTESQEHPLVGYGIHDVPHDEGVGRSLSHGCVRMREQDVRKLYLLCPVGTPVSIIE